MRDWQFICLKNYGLIKRGDLKMWQYAIIEKATDRYGEQWEIDGKVYDHFTDKSLNYVLNQYGAEGWELVTKDDDNTYIFKRLFKEE